MQNPHELPTPQHGVSPSMGFEVSPSAVAWFERAKPCMVLTIYDNDSDLRRCVLKESDEAFESRELTALYEFVRGMPDEKS